MEKQIKNAGRHIKGKVLDLGAGDLNRYGYLFDCDEYLKMDIKPGSNIDVVGSADNIPFPDRHFDSVVATQVFEHLLDFEKAAKEVNRVLKPGGIILTTVPQWGELHSEPHDYWRFTNFGLIKLFERNGFSVISRVPVGGFFSMIAQLKIRYLIDKFNLYHHSFWGRLFSKMFLVYGIFMAWLDGIDGSKANRNHTIGWCAVFKKL
mgnify:FL=1